ncbi:ADOP family duplicated permease [Paludibaculum fermentans]|uniref:ABC transporter permease n=1 Tax=Paludibaculum fermentans TaxID=1473598 RepID=UPI003EBE2CF2
MSWLTRFRNALDSSRLDDDLANEMRDHMERRAADLEARGLSSPEARRRAAIAFGNMARLREESRELKLWAAFETTFQDLRFAWRGLLRNPVFAVTTVLSLGLAIGANTAIYSLINAALLRPLPVPEPDRLITLTASSGSLAGIWQAGDGDLFSYLLYGELQQAAGDSARLALLNSPNRVEARAFDSSQPYEEVTLQVVSPNAFEVLGVSPAVGRLFSVEEDHYPSPRAVAVLSHGYWVRRFGADPGVIGRRFVADGRTYTILGVTSRGFSGAEPGKFVDVWLPVTVTDPGVLTNPAIRMFHLMGRLGPHATAEQLAARLQPTFRRHQEARIGPEASIAAAVREHLREMVLKAGSGATGISSFRQAFARPLWILLGISACTLLIACANVASLLLARSTARSAEMSLRVSLGARRGRLVRQLLTESLLISMAAGLCGWALACVAAPALVELVSTKANPVRLELALDPGVLLFCAAICALATLCVGLLPALQATRTVSMFTLRHSGGHGGRLRLGRLFVGMQVAFAFCLVTGGAGFLYSLRNLVTVDAGFDSKGVTVLAMTNTLQRDRQFAFMQELRRRTSSLPEVQGAATAWMAIFSGERRAQRVVVAGQSPSEREETFYRVSPGYFAALRTPLVSGRDLSLQDNDNEPVATVVNRAFARRYFGGEAVLGREFQRDDGVRHQIVGLAADSHFGSLRGGPEPIAYMPMKPPRAFTLYVRSSLDPGSVATMVDRAARSLGSGLRVRDATTLDALVEGTILKERLLACLGGAFALLGLMLAAIGLFGLLNYSVTRRTNEIGVRTALGARRSAIYGLVLQDLAGMVGGGMVVGLAGSLVLLRFTQSLLFEVRTFDPLVIGTAMGVFTAAAVIAGGLPARRAAAIDPMVALRHE